MSRWRRLLSGLARAVVFGVAAGLLLIVAAVLSLSSSWGKDQLRALVVSQANNYLTATLQIGELGGSLLRGIELRDVRLSRGADTLVSIDRVTLAYSIRELIEGGTVLRSLELDRPRITASRDPDGRWNLASLVRRDTQRPQGTGPRRPIRIDAIVITDGEVTLGDPVSFGAAHIPTRYTGLNTTVSFSYRPVTWTLDFTDASFVGTEPALTVSSLTGGIESGADGWTFRALQVKTPGSAFSLDGLVDRRESPTKLDLSVDAPRFAFQEWSGVLSGLRNLAVTARFDVRLLGPLEALDTTIELKSDGGDVQGDFVLNTVLPGWHAGGTASVRRLDLAHWLNRADRPSDISGAVRFDLDLDLGRHFPRGTFAFNGSHAAYIGYEADDIVARGTLTSTDVRIAAVTATAYGANVRLAPSTLAIDAPYGFRFVGTAHGLDLRQVPKNVPVPHVESTLALDFDVTGRFSTPFIRGAAVFDQSEFLGARIAAGATGSIDTSAVPFRYAGDGEVAGIDLHRFGEDLGIGWLTEPRFAGTVTGRFRVEGSGSDTATMTLSGGGHLSEASVFGGALRDGEVEIQIANGSLAGSYDGELVEIDPSLAMADERYAARLSGNGSGKIAVRDLLVRSPDLNDYRLDATLEIRDSIIRGVQVDTGAAQATMSYGVLTFARLAAVSPAFQVEASGPMAFDGARSSRLEYRLLRSDLSKLSELTGRTMAGELLTSGVLDGPIDALHLSGNATLTRFESSGVSALTTTATYDVTIPDGDAALARAQLKASLGFVHALGRDLPEVEADIAYDAGGLTAHLQSTLREGAELALHGTFILDTFGRTLDVTTLVLTLGRTTWRLAADATPRVAWSETAIDVTGLQLADIGNPATLVTAEGRWMPAGGGSLRIAAQRLSIDFLTSDPSRPSLYGGTMDLTADVTGSSEAPVVTADFTIVDGRIRRLSYDRFSGHVVYRGGGLTVDVRLDQSASAWLTAVGSVPAALFVTGSPPEPMNLAVKSSPVSLTLLEGLSSQLRDVSGIVEADLTVVGTTDDPHMSGTLRMAGVAFQATSSGARYRNGRVALRFATDRIDVETMHLEDEAGHPVDVSGSLGTHERRLGDLEVRITAKNFQVLNNEFGSMNLDASLEFTGEFESPRLTGSLGVTGGALSVDRILDRVLFRPYATEEVALPEFDPIAVLNPWDRMGLDVELKVPRTLRLVGEDLQVGPGTPIGLGSINLRVLGDLYLYKDPAQPLYVNGSFDQVTGAYVFQGRRFDLDPASSINFRGGLSPELYVMVSRVISGVEVRVSIVGPLQEPELRMTSIPPLDPSDVLSLIVFNTSTNQLTAQQQQQLAVRAGTLAAGFLAAPMLSSLERTLGIETIEIEPGADVGGGARLTIGNEIAPGLVARFSRQFGENQYDEATLEYYLSRILRVRATFTDAASLTALSPFRRVERAGIDLLFFFSF